MTSTIGSNSLQPVPPPLARASDHLAGYKRDWFICGGWAVDLLLGQQSRDHLDVDIAVFEEDQTALHSHLHGWNILGHDDAVAEDCSDQWDGRPLDPPAHVHANTDTMGGVELDIQICRRTDREWVFATEPSTTIALSSAYGESRWGGLPIVSAPVIIYYKAIPPRWRAKPTDTIPRPRPHDEADFAALLPALDTEQREWLHDAIAASHPRHDWLQHL